MIRSFLTAVLLFVGSLSAQTWGETGFGCMGVNIDGRGIPAPRVISNPLICPTNWNVFVYSGQTKPDFMLAVIGGFQPLPINPSCILWSTPAVVLNLTPAWDSQQWYGAFGMATDNPAFIGLKLWCTGICVFGPVTASSEALWWIWGPPIC